MSKQIVSDLIARFGGLPGAARAMGHRSHSTVQGWRKKGSVPRWRKHELLAALTEHGFELTEVERAYLEGGK